MRRYADFQTGPTHQLKDRACDAVRRNSMASDLPLEHLITRIVEKLSIDDPGIDITKMHIGIVVLQRDDLSHGNKSTFGSGIGPMTPWPHLRGNRCDIDRVPFVAMKHQGKYCRN